MDKIQSYRFIIKGKVQGVYYRKTIYENATLVNLNGYIKNLPNGNVEALLTAKNKIELKQFKKILKKGSMLSSVKSIEMFESLDIYDNGFVIK